MGEIVEGKLAYDDAGNYVVGSFNISDLLDKVYYARNNHISLRITNGNKLLFQEDSFLYKNKNMHGIYSYFITGADLETVLFDNTGEEVTVEVCAEAVGDYGQFYSTVR